MHFRHRQTDRLASWHKREMYVLHLALKISRLCEKCGPARFCRLLVLQKVKCANPNTIVNPNTNPIPNTNQATNNTAAEESMTLTLSEIMWIKKHL